MCEGIAAEWERIELVDKRLNKRSATILEALAAKPVPVPDVLELDDARVDMHGGVRRLRMEIRLESDEENSTAQETADAGRIHADAHKPRRLQ